MFSCAGPCPALPKGPGCAGERQLCPADSAALLLLLQHLLPSKMRCTWIRLNLFCLAFCYSPRMKSILMVRGFLGQQDQSVSSDVSVEDFYCSIILEMFHYCTTIVLVYSCFTVNVQFFSPCFLCPPFKINRLCSHLPCPCLISGPEHMVLLPCTLCLWVLAPTVELLFNTTAVWQNNSS